MRDGAVRTSRVFIVVAVILSVVPAALDVADPVIFGIHDHVTPEDTQSPHAHPAHHCDLSMSPAAVGPLISIVGPIVTSSATIDDGARAPRYTPFAPLRPPRA